jgi:hypothetical protein
MQAFDATEDRLCVRAAAGAQFLIIAFVPPSSCMILTPCRGVLCSAVRPQLPLQPLAALFSN